MRRARRRFAQEQRGEARLPAAVQGGAAAEGQPMGRYAFEVNLLGVLQFGPFARFHIQVGDELFVATLGANGGYRFGSPNGRYWNVGAFAGMFYDTWYEQLYFFGMLEVAWGKEFAARTAQR